MNFETPKDSELKHHLNVVNNRIGVLVVVGGAIITATLDYIFRINLTTVKVVPFTIVILAAAFGWTFQYFNKLQSFWKSVFLYGYLHLIAFVALAFIFPFPSPYLLFMMVLSLLVYFDLGIKASYVSGIGLGLAYLARALLVGHISHTDLGRFLVYYSITGLFLYYMINFLKITDDERRALELVSEQSELERSRLLTLVDNLNDAVIACDENLNILVSNPQAEKLLDTHGPISGKNIDGLLTLTNPKGEQIKLSKLLTDNPHKYINVFTNYKMFYSEHDFVNLYIAVSKIQHGQGDNSGYVLLLRDITKLKTLEDERDEFISIMSHELRTPVSIVEGGISLAQLFTKQGGMDGKVEQYLNKAHVQALMLAEIVNSLSTLVHSEQGGSKFSLKEINPAVVTDHLYTTYQPQIEGKGLQTIVRTDPNLPLLYTNEESMFEILQNFLTNAVKYTKTGSITIAATKYDDAHVAFSVSDSGIGMSKSDLAHVFEKFWRSEDFRTRESGGTGLGLYITKKLASRIGAKIVLESELDKGTTFTLVVPLQPKIEE